MFKKYLLEFKISGCANFSKTDKWHGKCALDNSQRNWYCYKHCPNCKPLLRNRIKAALNILKWNRRRIRENEK